MSSELVKPVSFVAQYKAGVFDSMLWVTCQRCNFDVFNWRSERPLSLVVIDDAVKRHERDWHSDKSE